METFRLFCDLVETKSFIRAAQLNGLSHSAVSLQIAAAEMELGDAFIDRTRRGRRFRLTRGGEIFHAHCLEICRLEGELRRKIQWAQETFGTRFEFATCYSIGLHQLPPVLRQFRLACPDLDIRVRYGFIDWVHQQVMADTVDFGLVCYPRRLPGLAIDPFRHERLALVCHPQHSLARKSGVALKELAGQTIIAWNEIHSSPFLKKVPHNLRHLFEPAQEFNEVEMVKRMVEINAGVAILPESLVRPEVADGRLASVTFENGGYTEPLAVIRRRTRKLTAPMNAFIQALKQPAPAAN